jgi:hypothetical protein
MIVKLLFQDREPYLTESSVLSFNDYSYKIKIETNGPNGTITGFDVEGLLSKSVNPPLVKTSDMTLTLQIQGSPTMEIVEHDMMLIKETPVKELPLIMNDILSWTGKKFFTEKINCVVES